MKAPADSYTAEVCIVGAGPTGLMLGAFLAKFGVDFLIVERHCERHNQSRSLGIHPPSISLFEELDLVEQLLNAAIKIHRGYAFDDNGNIGTLDFSLLNIPHPYVLSLPQHLSERILENHLLEDVILKGYTFSRYVESDQGVVATFNNEEKEIHITSRILVGADGKNSNVRQAAEIPFNGKEYSDLYAMGDFADTTSFENDAGIFLCQNGLVECFPLSGGKRRWVVKTSEYWRDISAEKLADVICDRTGHQLDPHSCSMISSFGVQGYLAERFAKGNVVLAGDAAHVVSPIGGQGMNLGWLDARLLAESLAESGDLRNYALHRRKAARKAKRRAEFNMIMGRATRYPGLKRLVAQTLLLPPINRVMVGLFTMRKLGT